jgi:hypothetical protein
VLRVQGLGFRVKRFGSMARGVCSGVDVKFGVV